jgi:hypothetical protein
VVLPISDTLDEDHIPDATLKYLTAALKGRYDNTFEALYLYDVRQTANRRRNLAIIERRFEAVAEFVGVKPNNEDVAKFIQEQIEDHTAFALFLATNYSNIADSDPSNAPPEDTSEGVETALLVKDKDPDRGPLFLANEDTPEGVETALVKDKDPDRDPLLSANNSQPELENENESDNSSSIGARGDASLEATLSLSPELEVAQLFDTEDISRRPTLLKACILAIVCVFVLMVTLQFIVVALRMCGGRKKDDKESTHTIRGTLSGESTDSSEMASVGHEFEFAPVEVDDDVSVLSGLTSAHMFSEPPSTQNLSRFLRPEDQFLHHPCALLEAFAAQSTQRNPYKSNDSIEDGAADPQKPKTEADNIEVSYRNGPLETTNHPQPLEGDLSGIKQENGLTVEGKDNAHDEESNKRQNDHSKGFTHLRSVGQSHMLEQADANRLSDELSVLLRDMDMENQENKPKHDAEEAGYSNSLSCESSEDFRPSTQVDPYLFDDDDFEAAKEAKTLYDNNDLNDDLSLLLNDLEQTKSKSAANHHDVTPDGIKEDSTKDAERADGSEKSVPPGKASFLGRLAKPSFF